MFAPRYYGGKAITAQHRSSSARRDHEAKSLLSEAERKELAAQKFDEWVRFKDSFDRGLALFAKLDRRHCEDEEAWKRVAVILAAIDRSQGNDLKVDISRGKRHQGSTKKAKAGPQSMFDAFKKWTMSGHTFTSVQLDAIEVGSLGPATRQFLEPEDGASEAATVLPSLTYNFPPPPARRGLRTRPLTDDQKALNAIFLRRVRAGWDAANVEMRGQLAKYVEDAELMYQARRRKALHIEDGPVCRQHPGGAAKGDGERESKVEEEEKRSGREEEEGKHEEGKDDDSDDETEPEDDKGEHNEAAKLYEEFSDDDMNQQGDVAGSRLDSHGLEKDQDEGLRARRSRFLDTGLVALGIRRLSELLEEDADRRKKKENDDRLEKEEEARRAHEGWTRVKDARRFRLPEEEPFRPGGVWKPPRFDFSGGKGLVRPNKNQIASTTLDIMRGQGLKYVHAITDGRQGVEGDLEKSKRKIKRYNETVIQEGKRRAAAREAEKTKAFQGWARLKEMKEASMRCLRAIDPPKQGGKPGALEHWLKVGRALKSVDVRLFAEWIAWTGTSFPVVHCQAVWDAISPKSCDTHSPSYSATRETFLKLLRPGVDYREAFHKVVRRRLRREGARIDDDDKVDKDDLVITRRELRCLLTKELGIVLRPEEMRRLVDAFDTNENRCIGWEEFENLTGGVRDAVRGDSAKRLERRCVWETTCRITGMPNAFTVCAIKETDRVGHGKNQRGCRPNVAAAAEEEAPAATASGGRVGGASSSEIITLRSGERRRRNELAERGRRLRILSKYGLTAPLGETKEKKGRGGARGEYDDDDFEAEEDDDDSYQGEEFERRSDGEGRNSPLRERSTCELSAWTMAKRMAGLKTLKRLSRANRDDAMIASRREADELRQLLSEGTAPGPPRFWSAKIGHPDVGEDDDALTEELLLCWKPQPGSAVAFFSLEICRPEGGKTFCHGTYREVCRDPPDSGGEPKYQHWVQGLSPNTRYGFRVRAFNGFGPGSYAHGCFATRPARPAQPVVTRATPTEISLQWIFGNKFAAKLRGLRQVFDTLDEQDDGEVVRDEFLASLELDHPQLMAVLKASLAAIGTEAAAVGPETASVFDALEANNDEFVCWEEIERHFAHASRGTRDAEHGCGGEQAQRTGRGSKGGNFILEICTSQEGDRWKEVWKGTTGTARVKALEPGQCYRFRVQATNCEGHKGTPSDPMVAHTLLMTPTALRLTGGSGRATTAGVWDNRVRLRWDAKIGGSAGAPSSVGGHKNAVEFLPFGGGGGGRRITSVDREAARILTQWANEGSEDSGVNVEMAFSRFDRHRRGVIDPLELGNVLEALGVEVTEQRLREAFTELIPDCCGGTGEHLTGGALSLEDFEAWWNANETTFALLRDDGVAGTLLEMAAARGDLYEQESIASINITSFKGRGHGCEVAGLSPNTLYRFRVRALNHRTRSSLSTPLEVMTAPRQPDPPVVIRSEERSIVFKWYPGPGGACKYLLQARPLEGLDGIGALAHVGNRPLSSGVARKKACGAATGEDKGGWATVYEGVDSTAKATGLAANSVYRFRVRGINLRGVPSEWSFPGQAATSQRCSVGVGERNTAPLYKPQCAAEVFNVDADDDIVVGDTIIFTERLYVDIYGDPITASTGAGGNGTGNTTPRAVLGTVSGTASGKGRGRAERGPPATARVAADRVGQAMPAGEAAGGAEFVGERTVAAHVLQDSFRSMKRKAKGGVLEYSRARSTNRVLRLEVIWSTVSCQEADAFVLPRGSIVERTEGRLSEFETFRALWEEDDRRKGVREEWALLSGVSR